MKYQQVCFYTSASRFDEIREMLKNEFGLVAPKPRAGAGSASIIDEIPALTEKEKIVWNAENGRVGYTVYFIPANANEDLIFFMSLAQDLSFKGHDPMLDAVKRTYELLEPVRYAVSAAGVILEEIVGRP